MSKYLVRWNVIGHGESVVDATDEADARRKAEAGEDYDFEDDEIAADSEYEIYSIEILDD